MSNPRITKVLFNNARADRRRGGEVRVLLSPVTVGSTSGFMGVATLEPGEFISEHYHPYSEEFLYVTRGSIVARLDGEPIALSAGEALMVPKNTRHRLENPGKEQASVVFQLGPLAPRPDMGHVDTEAHPNPTSQPGLHVGGAR
jgi:putative monooxygenase